MGTKILKKWTAQIKKVKSVEDAYDFEDSYEENLKYIKNICDDDAEALNEFIITCVDHGNSKVLDLASKVLQKRSIMNWKKRKDMLHSWLNHIEEVGKIPESKNEEYRNGSFFDVVDKIYKIIKAEKSLPEFHEELFGMLMTSFESKANRLHEPLLDIIGEFPWQKKPQWITKLLDKTLSVVKKYPALAKGHVLSAAVICSWVEILQKFVMKTHEAEKYVTYVTKVFLFCKDQDWLDPEDSDDETLSYELVRHIMEEYIIRHHASEKILKPVLPAVRELWKCDDVVLQSRADTVMQMSSTAGHNLVVNDTTEVYLTQYLNGEQPTLIGQFSQMYPKQPEAFHKRLDDLVDAMQGENWKISSTLNLLWEISKNSPQSFSKSAINGIVETLTNENTAIIALFSLQTLAEKIPKTIAEHDDAIIKCMKKNQAAIAQGGNILIELSKLSENYGKKYLKALKEVQNTCNSMMSLGILNNMKTIGNQYPQAIIEYKTYFESLKKDPALVTPAQELLDLIAGRSLAGLTKDIEEQKKEVDTLDTRVTGTEKNVIVVSKELHTTKKDVKVTKENISSHEKRLTEVEEVVEETVEKVDDIDKKTLSHAPSWSKDVAKSMNPKGQHDWRLLATRLGYKKDDIRNWATQPDPCLSLMDEWFATHKSREATFAVLKALQEMNRTDAAMIVENALKQVEDIVIDEEHDYATSPPVFISYQWGLQQEVKLLKKHLEMAGFECWMDVGQMGGGDKLFEKIDKGIRSAEVILCCVSEKYAASPNCNREVNLSVNLGKPVIPLLMEKMSWPPTGSMGPIFGEYLFIRFFARTERTAKDERYWPLAKFQELLMQIRYNVAPNHKLINNKLYKNWWNPPEEVLNVKQTSKTGSTTVAKSGSSKPKRVAKSPEIFLSYQWGKQPQIQALYHKLTEHGYTCWLDIMEMGGGDSLYDKIDRGVRGCDVMLSCVTSKYVLSANCRREVSLADALKRPIIPLLLEDINWPPEGPMALVFTQLLYIDFSDEKAQTTWNSPHMKKLLEKISDIKSGKAKEICEPDNNVNVAKPDQELSENPTTAGSSINKRMNKPVHPVATSCNLL